MLAPYGVRGWLKIHPLGDDPLSWREVRQWWLGSDGPDATWHPYAVEDFRPHGSQWILKLASLDSRTKAEAFDGWYVGAMRSELPETRQDEYYWTDLIGLAVVNDRDVSLGKVTSLVETGAHEVLIVSDGERERLLPFVAQVVKDVQVSAGFIRVAWEAEW